MPSWHLDPAEGTPRAQGAEKPSRKVDSVATNQYDPARRRKGKRHHKRERGCWVYLPADELAKAGFLDDEPPFYRTTGHQRSANAGTVIVSLYREP